MIVAGEDDEYLQACVESVRLHTHEGVPVLQVAPSASAVNGALEQLAPADVLLLSEPCQVSAGWLERLRDAARADTNTATASALADAHTALALSQDDHDEDFDELAVSLREHTLRLLPRISRAVGPCVYVRREALELVGPLDEQLELRLALEVDFAQRCLLSGLAHVAADDVVVGALAQAPEGEAEDPYGMGAGELPAILLERYPYLSEPPALADSGVLARALEAARGPARGCR